jgi:transposase
MRRPFVFRAIANRSFSAVTARRITERGSSVDISPRPGASLYFPVEITSAGIQYPLSTKAQDEVVVISPSQPGRRRTYSAAEKQRILAEVAEPGASVSSVARRWRISPSVVFRWRKLHEEGGLRGLDADEPVVPESEVKQLRAQVRELQRMLGKKTME